MTWIALAAWIGLTSVFLTDGPLLVATLGDRMSMGLRQLYLAVPLLFGPAALLLTPWRNWLGVALASALLLHVAGHFLWVRSLRLQPMPPELAQRVDDLCREWGAPAPAAVAAGHFGPAVVGLRRQTLVLPPAVLGLPEFDLRAVLA
ncbi:MAG TPA: hypothetical protein VNT75_19155, partial [Symbiobacteriaceae bacterium]|nr:hypothetical protein [Symbiobacteriaceae bacterium]